MIGDKLRHLRQSQARSLADVAGKAKVSVATLSRIENDKQAVNLGLFLLLAKVLQVPPHELLSDDSGDSKVDPLARRIAGLGATDRTDFWRDLAAERRTQRTRRSTSRDIGQQVEELLAQVDFLREELESVRKRVKRR